MEYDTQIHTAESDPQQLEQLFQSARDDHQVEVFRAAIVTRYKVVPENVLLAAWYYRLQNLAEDVRKSDIRRPGRVINWLAAVPLSILTGLIFWAISDVENFQILDLVPQIALWCSPVATLS